jgi:hypothetical protein
MLLSELRKYTPKGHVDRDAIEQALSLMQGVATSINETKRATENNAKLTQISRETECPKDITIVEPHRRYLYEGVLYKCDKDDSQQVRRILTSTSSRLSEAPSRDRRKRTTVPFTGEKIPFYFFLFNDILMMTSESMFGAKYRFVNSFPIDKNLTIDPFPIFACPGYYFFELIYPTEKVLFAATSEDEKSMWVKEIGRAMTISITNENVGEKGSIFDFCRCRGWLFKRGDHLKVWNERYFSLKGKTLFFHLKEDGEVRSKIDNLDTFVFEISASE